MITFLEPAFTPIKSKSSLVIVLILIVSVNSFSMNTSLNFAHFVCSSSNFCFANTIYMIQNACSWLARSGETHDYDLLSVSKDDWQVWTGKVQTFELSIKCNDCFGYSDCNYHGTCNEDRRCECLDSVSTFIYPCLVSLRHVLSISTHSYL